MAKKGAEMGAAMGVQLDAVQLIGSNEATDNISRENEAGSHVKFDIFNKVLFSEKGKNARVGRQARKNRETRQRPSRSADERTADTQSESPDENSVPQISNHRVKFKKNK